MTTEPIKNSSLRKLHLVLRVVLGYKWQPLDSRNAAIILHKEYFSILSPVFDIYDTRNILSFNKDRLIYCHDQIFIC